MICLSHKQALAAHRLGFKSVQEYAIVLALLHSHPHHVAAVLVAAGSAPDAKDSRVHMPEAAAPTVSWPPLVVQRLAMAMDFKREPIAARRRSWLHLALARAQIMEVLQGTQGTIPTLWCLPKCLPCWASFKTSFTCAATAAPSLRHFIPLEHALPGTGC